MNTKPSVIVSVGLAVGVTTFVAAVLFRDGPQAPLPPQPSAEAAVVGTASTTSRSTTIAPDLLDKFALREPDALVERSLPSAERALDAACDEPTVVLPPAPDLGAMVAAAEPYTCFLLEAGEYRFSDVEPKDYMTFLGSSRDEVVVVGSASAENAFHGTATGVSIGRMKLVGFQGSAGEKRQEQGAIRGTPGIWESDRGQLATHWLIEDIEASGNFATGVYLGDHFTVRNSTLTDNGVAGLGGSETVGGLIENNIVSRNGAEQATGYLANGAGMKFTEAISPEDPLVVRGNEIYENNGIGVWCDIGCHGFAVLDNHIHDQDSRAIMFELSGSAVISGNLLVNTNSWTDFSGDFNAAAITIGESSDVIVEDNYIEGAEAGIIVRQTRRPVYPQEAFLDRYDDLVFVSERVIVRDNVIVDTKAMGLSTGATGRDLIRDSTSIRFEGNLYAEPGRVAFWWNGDKFNHGEWQDSGRDLGVAGEVPDRSGWPRES